jgi:integrase
MEKTESIWEDQVVKRWLDTIVKAGTKYSYKSAFKAYLEYTKLSPEQLIDEAVEDSLQDPRQRKDVLLTRVLGFYAYLKNDYEKKSRGTGPHHVIGKGVSDKLATMYTAAVRSFYGTYDLTIKLKGRRRLPKSRVENKRMIVGAEQVKTLYDHARSPRDRAIILVNFQGGLDASTLCSIKYGDVAEGLAKNQYPLKLALQRPKTGTDFYTFLGRDAVEALRSYLADMKQRGVEFTHSTPLFLQTKTKTGMITDNVQDMMREVAIRAGFIDNANNGHSFNPLGPHALRESFGSIMTNSGVPDTIVDFWLGHEIGEMSEAYKSVQFDSLRQMYLAREKLLSISAQKVDVEEIKEKLRGEMEQQNRALVRSLSDIDNARLRLETTNLELTNRIARVELENTDLTKANLDLKNRVQGVERKLSDFEKHLSELNKAFQNLEKT